MCCEVQASGRRCEDSQGPGVVITAVSKGSRESRVHLRSPGWPPALSGLGGLTHRIVAEELTVAAVAELPVSLVGGG